PTVGDATLVHAGRGAGRRGLEVALPGWVAAPVAYVAVVRSRAAHRIRGDTDGDHLLHLALSDTEELHAIATGRRHPDSARRVRGDPGRVSGPPSAGLLQRDRG